jgi:hypothetical protein
MAKGIKAAPKKRRKKRLSEHARLVEERARSIPPRVVHELFDTSTLPVPPPAPHRHAAAGRLVSKPPPPPPRPSRAPEDAEDADLEDLEELEEVDGSEESQTDGFGSHTISPSGTPGAPGEGTARGRSQRSRALPAVLGVVIVGTLALVTGRELGRSQSVAPRVEGKVVAPAPVAAPERPAALPSPPGPVADDLPLLPPGVTPAPIAEPPGDIIEGRSPGALDESGTTAPPPSDTTPATGAPELLAHVAPAASALGAAPSELRGLPPFDAAVADVAIQAAFRRAQGCRSSTDPKGTATVTLTYAPSGRITTALVSGIYAGTPIGSCIAAALRSARIEPFTGALVTVKRTAAFE